MICRVRTLAVVLLASVAGSSAGASARRSCEPARPLGDAAALVRTLRCASAGATITLAPDARFGAVALSGSGGAAGSGGGVTIRSVDRTRPARFQGLTMRNMHGVTLRDVAFEGEGGNGQRAMLSILGGSGLRVEGVTFTGDPVSFRPELEAALTVRKASDVTIASSRIEGFRNGVALRDSSRIVITGNAIRRMQTDGIRAAGVRDLRIARNVIASFTPAPRDHPDGVQLWSRNPQEASENIVIEENLILKGQGMPIQGIFLRAAPNAPFRNVTIRANMVVGQRWNGIAVMGADTVAVSANAILPMSGQMSWLRLASCTNAIANGNQAGRFVVNADVRQTGNVLTGLAPATESAIRQWRARLALPADRFPD